MEERKRALIISPEVDLALLLKSYYLRKEYAVHCTYTLKQGLSLAIEIQPHLIILDTEFSGDFNEFQKKLRTVAPNAEIKTPKDGPL